MSFSSIIGCVRYVFVLIGVVGLLPMTVQAQEWTPPSEKYIEENDQIRRDKFDQVLPGAMRERGVDMWIHVMREAIPDRFGVEELGSTSGIFIFTDRGGDRIERAVLGRRWGATQRNWGQTDYKKVEECGAYDVIGTAVRVQEPVGSPMTEYDYRYVTASTIRAVSSPSATPR